jgi:hypothetical protein
MWLPASRTRFTAPSPHAVVPSALAARRSCCPLSLPTAAAARARRPTRMHAHQSHRASIMRRPPPAAPHIGPPARRRRRRPREGRRARPDPAIASARARRDPLTHCKGATHWRMRERGRERSIRPGRGPRGGVLRRTALSRMRARPRFYSEGVWWRGCHAALAASFGKASRGKDPGGGLCRRPLYGAGGRGGRLPQVQPRLKESLVRPLPRILACSFFLAASSLRRLDGLEGHGEGTRRRLRGGEGSG